MEISKGGKAAAHTLVSGDVSMKKKSYRLHFVRVEDRSAEIITALAKREIEKVLDKHGAVSYNLDEILSKYITGVMCSDQKGQGICSGIDDERLPKGQSRASNGTDPGACIPRRDRA